MQILQKQFVSGYTYRNPDKSNTFYTITIDLICTTRALLFGAYFEWIGNVISVERLSQLVVQLDERWYFGWSMMFRRWCARGQ